MNLAQLIQYITNIAKEHPLVKTVIEGDVYQLNSKEVKYGVFCITQPMNNIVKDNNVKKYTFTIFYVDRLCEDESNKLVVQTDGINTIHEVFNYIKTNSQTANVDIPITFTTFTQKFADKCGGAYANVVIEVDDETGDCDFYYEDILIEPIPGTSHTTVLDNYYTKVEVEDLVSNIKHNDLQDLNENTDFLHINQEEKALIVSTADAVSKNTEDILDLQEGKANKATTLGGYGITDAYTKTYIDNNKQDKLIAGENIVISDNEISADLSAYLTTDNASDTYETIENVNLLADDISKNTEDIEDLQSNKIVHILYADLLELKNNGELVKGQKYRIIDYSTKSIQSSTTSAEHDFDIIVQALDSTTLSEDASVTYHDGDTYFENAKLNAWEIKYCLDNDTDRFAWANTSTGKGVIYYMKDEWGNECPYDFKNIQYFKNSVWVYTFGGEIDDSLAGGSYGNIIKEYMNAGKISLNSITFGTGCNSNTFGNNCISNTFGNDCHSNKIGNTFQYNKFGDGCHSNTFGGTCYANTFGYSCSYNKFGGSCYSNAFGYLCYSNTFGNNCYSNIFGNNCFYNTSDNNCYSNTFGNSCCYNTLGNGCFSNTIGGDGNYCYYNTFGNDCSYNTLGSVCQYNTFGKYCRYIKFGAYCSFNTVGNGCVLNNFYAETSGMTPKSYIRYIVLEDGVGYNNFYSDITTSITSYLQNIRIKGLKHNEQTNVQITLPEVNTNYEWVVCYTSDGTLKQYCPDD